MDGLKYWGGIRGLAFLSSHSYGLDFYDTQNKDIRALLVFQKLKKKNTKNKCTEISKFFGGI